MPRLTPIRRYDERIVQKLRENVLRLISTFRQCRGVNQHCRKSGHYGSRKFTLASLQMRGSTSK